MRIGLATILMLRLGGSWEEAVDRLVWTAREGDRLGFANIWLTEHHFTEIGATNSPGVLLAHLAAVTGRIRLGYSVALVPFNHPIRLAEEMLLVDRLSHGRLDIGIGRGHAPIEVAALCPDPARSDELFAEGVAVIEAAFAARPVALDGFWKIPEVQLFPPPHAPGETPIYMPITSPRSVEFAAAHQFIPLLGSRPRDEIRATVAAYRTTGERLGLPPDRLDALLDGASGNRYVAYCASRDEAEEQVRREVAYFHYGHALYQKPVGDPAFHRDLRPVPPLDLPVSELMKFAIWGTRDDLVDQLRELEAAGLRQVSVSLDAACTPRTELEARMERFARDVLPAVQGVALSA